MNEFDKTWKLLSRWQNTRLLNFACCAFLIEPASTETYAFAPKASWKLTCGKTFDAETVR